MAARKGIVIICNLDTRGEDIVFVKDLIAGRGHEPILLDFSMEEPPPSPLEDGAAGAGRSSVASLSCGTKRWMSCCGVTLP